MLGCSDQAFFLDIIYFKKNKGSIRNEMYVEHFTDKCMVKTRIHASSS